VVSEAQMAAALDRGGWDVVLSDYSMPGFSGAAALQFLRQRALDIPFIIVSGVIAASEAVEMLKAGAGDYVMKDDLIRLVPAIEREIRATHEREARRRSEEIMGHLAAIVESSDDAIFSNSLGGTILSWNGGAERIFGYTAAEVIGRSTEILAPIGLRDETVNIMAEIERGGRVVHYEAAQMCKDGQQIHAALTVSPIYDPAGKVIAVSTVARNITERRQKEEERSRLIHELRRALAQVKTLRGLLPICAWCKKIRDDQGYWQKVETYVEEHSHAEFTHGICPECMSRQKPQPASAPS
jgi:PAS domain S-box-containing protein